ncbi:unnamed protein product [Protopolystoma xenopodis]|uniref:Uncharacterized protein n=1 Tax=Protopolystoma xenopodis TaxID=117903 RepID=A0A3S5AGB7_9PLAT|nr:unnamed protein product [Protopolystoma xenopodis]
MLNYELRDKFLAYKLRFHYNVTPVNVEELINQLAEPLHSVLLRLRDAAVKAGLVAVTNHQGSIANTRVCRIRLGKSGSGMLILYLLYFLQFCLHISWLFDPREGVFLVSMIQL